MVWSKKKLSATYNTGTSPHVRIVNVITDINMKCIVLIRLDERPGELPIDENGIPCEAVGRDINVGHIELEVDIGSKNSCLYRSKKMNKEGGLKHKRVMIGMGSKMIWVEDFLCSTGSMGERIPQNFSLLYAEDKFNNLFDNT